MKTYLSDVIPAIKRKSKKLDDVTVLKNVHWKLVDEESNSRIVYIFRDQNELLISKNGEVEKGKWEHLGGDSILIEIDNKAYLFKQGFYNDYALGLKKDGVNEYAIMINEEKIDKEIRSLKDLDHITNLLNPSSNESKTDVKEKQTPKSEDVESIDSDSDRTNKTFLTFFLLIFFWLIIYALANMP